MTNKSAGSIKLMGGVVVLLLISSLLPVQWARVFAVLPQRFVSAIISPVSATFRDVSVSATGGEEGKGLPVPSLEKYDELQAYYADAKQYIAQLLIENQELREQVSQLQQFRESWGGVYSFLEARVTMNTSDKLNPVITLDRGNNKNVIVGNVIVSRGRNLVGMVVDSSALTCSVQLVTSETSPPLGVIFIAPRDGMPRHRVEQFLERDNKNARFFVDVNIEDPIYAGDWAHLRDSSESWPEEARGNIVGEVTEVIDHPIKPLLLKRVIVKPRINLERLTRVYVILPGDPDDG